jgi:hypothetical protein
MSEMNNCIEEFGDALEAFLAVAESSVTSLGTTRNLETNSRRRKLLAANATECARPIDKVSSRRTKPGQVKGVKLA